MKKRGEGVNGSFDSAFGLFVGHRIDELDRDNELSKCINGMIAEIERKLNELITDLEMDENKLVLEAIQDLVFKYNHEMFKTIYKNGFLDGLYLDKQSKTR